VLKKTELHAIIRGLNKIGLEIRAGKFKWKPELEDVHMNIEAELTKRVPAGAKLHTARSRNDQVALDVRLWLRDEITALLGDIAGLQRALVSLGEKNSDVLIPGYTHLQRAQPVYLAHHLLAYVEMLERDCERLWDCHSRVNVCPLGSGAIAGSTLPLDRALVAKLLGFVNASGQVQLTQNSMDAVGDRDFAVEFCAAGALLAVHLSRLAEDVILWASAEFNFIKIADAYTTGSSLMPQKKNPDIAELARGKTGRVFGNLMSLLTLLKGLPMTYNRDLQEDKERLFDTADTVRATTRLMAAMLRNTKINKAKCDEAAGDQALLVTDLVDYLVVQKKMPFRQAHHIVGAVFADSEIWWKKFGRGPSNDDWTTLLVKHIESSNFKTHGLDKLYSSNSKAAIRARMKLSSKMYKEASGVFNLKTAMAKRNLTGAPGTKEVAKQLARWREQLS
jgi:argininosuccinate lyase